MWGMLTSYNYNTNLLQSVRRNANKQNNMNEAYDAPRSAKTNESCPLDRAMSIGELPYYGNKA